MVPSRQNSGGRRRWGLAAAALMLLLALTSAPLRADEPARRADFFDSARLLATSGVSQLEGSAGGGLAAWSVIAGYGSRDAVGANAHYTFSYLPDFTLQSGGVAIGIGDRVELSWTRIAFDTRAAGGRLGIGRGFTFDEDVFGLKLRVAGDAVYDQDRWLPQLAVGVEYKRNDEVGVLRAIGARDRDGVDYYVAGTKLFLAQSLLVDATVRATRANQFGILGFGGDKNNAYRPEFEGSAALLLSRSLALGAEYRTKPDNLSFAKEQNAADVFLAWFPSKHFSATLAFVALGDIAREKNQNGVWLSLQAGF